MGVESSVIVLVCTWLYDDRVLSVIDTLFARKVIEDLLVDVLDVFIACGENDAIEEVFGWWRGVSSVHVMVD